MSKTQIATAILELIPWWDLPTEISDCNTNEERIQVVKTYLEFKNEKDKLSCIEFLEQYDASIKLLSEIHKL